MTKIQQTETDNRENGGNSPLKGSENDDQIKLLTKTLEQVNFTKLPSPENDKDDIKNLDVVDTNQLILHPAFYTPLKKIVYVDRIKGYLGTEKKKQEANNADSVSVMQNLQKYLNIVTNKNQSWKELIPQDDAVRLIRGWDGYIETELYHLIRLVRNFKEHLDEIKAKNANSAKIRTIESQENALYHMLNKFPNLISTIKVFETTVMNQPEATQVESNQSQKGTVGFSDRHADIRWILYELSLRMLHLDKQEGKLVAAYVSTQPTDSHINFLRHSHNHPDKNTTVITIKQNSADIETMLYNANDSGQTNFINSFSWEENEWSATPVLIIITEDLTKALKVIEKNLQTNVVVLLGNEKGNLDNIRREMDKIEKYNYVPTCWSDLGESYQNELMSRKILVCGKERSLQWIGIHNDIAFSRLEGELLLSIISDNQPEIMNPERNKFEPPNIFVPLETLNVSGKTCIVTGAPFCGKSVGLQQHTNSNEIFTFVLQTRDFLEWYLSQVDNNVGQAVATFLANSNFGRDAVLSYLTSAEKQVQIIFDEFQMVLDEEYDNLNLDETETNLNTCILETCSNIIKNLKKFPSVSITAATRSQCVDYLKTLIDQQLVQPFLSLTEAETMISKFSRVPEIHSSRLHSIISYGETSYNVTPLLCDVISSTLDLTEKENSNVGSENSIQSQVRLCQTYCEKIFQKRMKIDNIVSKRDKNSAYYEMTLVHVYIAYKTQFPDVGMKFLENLFFCRFNRNPSVSGLDYGLLKFKSPDFNKTKTPIEQGIEFVDAIFLKYWIAYGIIFLSLKCIDHYEKEWEAFLTNNMLNEKCQSIFEYFVNIFKHCKVFTRDEKEKCKRVLLACRKQMHDHSDKEMWTLLDALMIQ